VKEGLLAPKACAFYMVPSRHSGEDIDWNTKIILVLALFL
jgi:hypothetical protein